MKRHVGETIAIAIVLSLLGGCAMRTETTDRSGFALIDANAETGSERFVRASERYRELNEFLAGEMRSIAPTEWVRNGTSLGFMPRDGSGMDRYLRGAEEDNSYYFEVLRIFPEPDSTSRLQRELKSRWIRAGWSVREEVSDLDGTLRVIAVTDQDYWIAADEESDGLYLTAHTPPYWGTYMELADDVHERYEAEKARGEHARFDIDEDAQMLLLPGDYRPFPRWDAVD